MRRSSASTEARAASVGASHRGCGGGGGGGA